MNSLFQAFLAPLVQKSLTKLGTWALRQDLGKSRGNDKVAQDAPEISALAGAGAAVAAQALSPALDKMTAKIAAQKDVQKLAGQLGVPTTSQGVLSVITQAVDSHPTLNLDDKDALKLFLASRLLGG